MAIEHADFDGIERLALVTGGEIVSTFGKPELVKIGKCDLIEQVFPLSWNFHWYNFSILARFQLVMRLCWSSVVFLLEKRAVLSSEERRSRSSARRRGVSTTLCVFSLPPWRSQGPSMGAAAQSCWWQGAKTKSNVTYINTLSPNYVHTTCCNILLLNRAVDELASVTPGKEARAMSSFANALRWSRISIC